MLSWFFCAFSYYLILLCWLCRPEIENKFVFGIPSIRPNSNGTNLFWPHWVHFSWFMNHHRTEALSYCVVNIFKETSDSWCSVFSSWGATLLNMLTHTAMAMGTVFLLCLCVWEETECRRGFVSRTVCVLCVSRGDMCEPVELRGNLTSAHTDTVLQNAPNRAEQLLLWVSSSVLFTLPASVRLCLCHTQNSYASLSQIWPHSLFCHLLFSKSPSFFLLPVLLLSLPAFFSLLRLLLFFNLVLSFALAYSLFYLPLSPSPPFSFPLPLFLLQPQCSSLWIAGMLLLQVSIVTDHLNKLSFTFVCCRLERGHGISPRRTGRPVPLGDHNCFPAPSEPRIFSLELIMNTSLLLLSLSTATLGHYLPWQLLVRCKRATNFILLMSLAAPKI